MSNFHVKDKLTIKYVLTDNSFKKIMLTYFFSKILMNCVFF